MICLSSGRGVRADAGYPGVVTETAVTYSRYMSVQPDPAVKDPSTDPTASYALEPAFVRALTDRIVSSTGRSVPTSCPFNGQPIGTVPQSSAADVAEAFAGPAARRSAGRGPPSTSARRCCCGCTT